MDIIQGTKRTRTDIKIQRDQANQDGYYQRNQANPYIYQRNQVKPTNHKLTTKKQSEIIKKL